jgi:hypothetical protein
MSLNKQKIILKWLTQNMWHIGAIVNMINKKIVTKFIWKFIFMEKVIFDKETSKENSH